MVLAGWNYGETANEPTATAKFGTAAFTYATSENGTYSETVPIDAGDYWVKATVAETKNYAGATQTLKFTIAKAHSAITSNPPQINSLITAKRKRSLPRAKAPTELYNTNSARTANGAKISPSPPTRANTSFISD